MNFNGLKLVLATVLTMFFIVAGGVGWVDSGVVYGWVALTLGYILGNAKVSDREGGTSPIIDL